ncbi:MAG TPA: LamG domain-containing protein, partial [Candidatus Acidoferrum sp.]|nr:LamG domain-containing protein [Candidatus Acidoferrum sp.]
MAALALLAPDAQAGSGCDTPPSGLVSWWQAESNALDHVGGNSGTLVNKAGYTVGEVGAAFAFTNALAAVQIGNATNLQLQTFTIEAWIQRASAASVSFPASGDAEFFGFGSQGYGFGICGPSGDTGSPGTLFLTENDVDAVVAIASVTDTNFHHVAVTKSGSTVVFYVDGVAYPAGTTGDTYQFTTAAAIGARGDTLANSFYGSIDEMSIYNRGLSGSEIMGIFNAGPAGKCPVPVIVTQPVSQSVLVGTQVMFFVVAQSTNALSYQW